MNKEKIEHKEIEGTNPFFVFGGTLLVLIFTMLITFYILDAYNNKLIEENPCLVEKAEEYCKSIGSKLEEIDIAFTTFSCWEDKRRDIEIDRFRLLDEEINDCEEEGE